MKILLIEDDARTAAFILKGLKQAGFTTVHAEDGKTGLFKAKTEEFDLAVIDIMLPVMDGFSVIEKIRAAKITTPIIILSAKNAVEDKIRGLQLGSDDYLAKPFSFSELLARIQALLRRANTASDPTTLTVADLTIDLLSHRVTRGNVRIDIQPLEFQLLEYLVRNTGRVVSKTMIMEHVWEYNFDPQTNVVEARVCRLRDKIDKPFERKLIHTVRGFGYVLE
ncbi:MAG TPA: DNA-binding response regulator [Lentisphaeria bacterium]|nr:DNA-binding response regulator [Lentisphaeria bacterium]HCG51578.1 DNA-binding response regulator [Lentisphaeria bacterium]